MPTTNSEVHPISVKPQESPAHLHIMGNVNCKICIISDFIFLVPQKYYSSSVVAILNFSRTLKKKPIHLRIRGKVIATFRSDFKFRPM